jgi:hypothetical protein
MPIKQFAGLFILQVLIAFLLASPVRAAESNLQMRIEHAITRVKSENTTTKRADAAKCLYLLTLRRGLKRVDDSTIAEVVSLLDTDEDSVRYWVALSLRSFGLRAKMAIPRLEVILKEDDCALVSMTAASAVRSTLEAMGVTPKPSGCDSDRL